MSLSVCSAKKLVNFSMILLNLLYFGKQTGWFLRPDCAPSSEWPQLGMPPSFDRCTPPRRQFNQNIAPSIVLLQQCQCRNRHRGKLQNYFLRQFCVNRVQFFLQYTGDIDAKNHGPEFWNSNSAIFENFLKFSKSRHAVPLRPIWTILVAAKLDHSRVPVTKFRQNRLTLKGRNASQRHTDRQIRLKIMALQVCNRAKFVSARIV